MECLEWPDCSQAKALERAVLVSCPQASEGLRITVSHRIHGNGRVQYSTV